MRVLALGAVLLGLAAPSAPAQTLCDTVAKTISSVRPAKDPPGPWASPIHTLHKESHGGVVVDREGWRAETKDALLARLRDEYRADTKLLEVIGQQWTVTLQPTVHRFGRSSLHFSQTVSGTAYCQRFVFFDAPSGNPGHVVDPPPIATTGGDTAFCWRTSGSAGEIDGVPAFIVQKDQDNTVELAVTPWRDGTWGSACRVTVTFENDFEASQRFCQGVNCEAMADRAVSLAREIDESPRVGFGILDVGKLAGDAALDSRLPTPGGKLEDPQRSTYSEFFNDTMFFPIVVDGEMYLGRIGHAAFAWRKSANYLFAAYKMTGRDLKPVAGIYIDKTRARPADIKVD